MSFGELPRPFTPKLVRAGAPHTAFHEAAFISGAESLWFHCSGTRRTWVWPDPDVAPWIDTATVGSFVNFKIGSSAVNVDLQLPWLYAKGVTAMAFWVQLAGTASAMSCRLRAILSDLDASVTENSGPDQHVGFPAEVSPPPGALWHKRTDAWRFTSASLQVNTIVADNMTAERHGAIKLAANFDFGTTPDNLSTTRRLRLYAVYAQELFTLPTPTD